MTQANYVVFIVITIIVFGFITIETNRFLLNFFRNYDSKKRFNWWQMMLITSLAIIFGTIAFPKLISVSSEQFHLTTSLPDQQVNFLIIALLLAIVSVVAVSSSLTYRYSLVINVLMAFLSAYPILFIKYGKIHLESDIVDIFLKIIGLLLFALVLSKAIHRLQKYFSNEKLKLFLTSLILTFLVVPYILLTVYYLILTSIGILIFFYLVIHLITKMFPKVLPNLYDISIIFLTIFSIAGMDTFSYFSIPYFGLNKIDSYSNKLILSNITLILSSFALVRVLILWIQSEQIDNSDKQQINYILAQSQEKKESENAPLTEYKLFFGISILYLACYLAVPFPLFAGITIFAASDCFPRYKRTQSTIWQSALSGVATFIVAIIYAVAILWIGGFMIGILSILSLFCILIYTIIRREKRMEQLKESQSNQVNIQPLSIAKFLKNSINLLNTARSIYSEIIGGISRNDDEKLNQIRKKVKKSVNKVILLRENWELWKNNKTHLELISYNYTHQALNSLQELFICLNLITIPAYKYIKQKRRITTEQIKEIEEINANISAFINLLIIKIENENFIDFSLVEKKENYLLKLLEISRKQQNERFQKEKVKNKNNLLFLNLLTESKNIEYQCINIITAIKNLYTVYPFSTNK